MFLSFFFGSPLKGFFTLRKCHFLNAFGANAQELTPNWGGGEFFFWRFMGRCVREYALAVQVMLKGGSVKVFLRVDWSCGWFFDFFSLHL